MQTFISPPPAPKVGSIVFKITAILLTFIFFQLMAGLWMVLFQKAFHWTVTSPMNVALSLCLASLCTILCLVAFRWVRRRPLSFEASNLRFWGIPLLAFMLFAFGLNLLLSRLHLDDMGTTLLFSGLSDNALGFITLSFIGPLCEELVFREGIQRQLSRLGWSPVVVILISAAAFGVAHLNPAQMVPAFLLGLLLGYLYYKVGDIRLCLAAHVINNSLSLILIQFPEVDAHFEAMSNAHLYFVGGLLMFHGIIFTLFWRRLNKMKPRKS